MDNIPLTAAVLPVIGTLSANLTAESNILWWALAFGTGFGGNFTYISSPANEMIVSLSEDHQEPIKLKYWLKYGTAITLLADSRSRHIDPDNYLGSSATVPHLSS